MNKLEQLAQHILDMDDDAYLSGHPEWNEILKEAKEALKSQSRGNKIALLKDNQLNYDMGAINTQSYLDNIERINKM